jgi:hypothetical protein
VFGDKLKEESPSMPMSATAPRSGSTAVTTKQAAGCWRKRLPSSTSACRARCM